MIRPVRGFSLIELLLAVFILAIGIIGVAAIFPAGIVTQRQSQDDTYGPLVAESALSILRGKVRVRDFGSFEEFFDSAGNPATDFIPSTTGPLPLINPSTLATNFPAIVTQGYRPLIGDWRWKRPTIIFQDNITGLDPANGYQGAIDVFGATLFETINASSPVPLIARVSPVETRSETGMAGYPASATNLNRCYGIPWNRNSSAFAPWAIVTMRERTWPQGSDYLNASARQQYVWDCMFRRRGGRIQVAVFVYRVSAPGGESGPYTVAENAIASNPADPLSGPLPVFPRMLTLPSADRWGTGGADNSLTTAVDSNTIINTAVNSGPPNWSLSVDSYGWQNPGQWIVDNFGNVHRLAQGRRSKSEGPVRLSSPIPYTAPCAANFPYGWLPMNSGQFDGGQVSNSWVDQIWFMPTIDSVGNNITPIFVAVQEL
ncbi:MAG: prepilin-type N-terminal cleavage/methylation domain-containing protein [Planctomycetota bacterium]|nr:prepilin-type N-terminal cleavage/methylation domain-containing protein [Planctomycetota bacterium]